MILVNKKLSSDTWLSLDIGSPDVMGVILDSTNSKFLIFNFYCDQNNSDAMRKAENFLQAFIRNNMTERINVLWIGDFNRHHPVWDDPRNNHLLTRHNLDEVQILLDVMAR